MRRRNHLCALFRPLILTCVLVAASLAVLSELPGRQGRAYAQEETQAQEQQPPAEQEEAVEPVSEKGTYISPFWLAFVMICFAAWLCLTSWVCDDAMGVGINFAKWTSIMVGVGAVGFLMILLIHAAFGFFILACLGGAFALYVMERDKAVPEHYKLIRPDRLQGVLDRFMFWRKWTSGGVSVAGATSGLEHVLSRQDGKRLEELVEARKELRTAALVTAQLLGQAIDVKASSMQLAQTEGGVQVALEMDGVVQRLEPLETELGAAVLGCLGWLIRGGASGGQGPQQTGRFYAEVPGQERIEVTGRAGKSRAGPGIALTFPDWTEGIYKDGLEALGMHRPMAERLHQALQLENGAVLASGPPRSGITTTLYAMVSQVDIFTREVISIEEEIEHELDQVNRMKLDAASGKTFQQVYTLAMREEPNVIMFGELKEPQSATQLFKFAVEQGLLMSAVKAERSTDALVRLAAKGVDCGLMAQSLKCVVNQRLVRKLCEFCKEPFEPSPEFLSKLKIDPQNPGTWFKPVGCERCLNTGYAGRTAVFEMLIVTDPVKKILKAAAGGAGKLSEAALRKAAGRGALRPLRAEGLLKVKAGITTLDEIRRCLGS